jgi:hypothetical protein
MDYSVIKSIISSVLGENKCFNGGSSGSGEKTNQLGGPDRNQYPKTPASPLLLPIAGSHGPREPGNFERKNKREGYLAFRFTRVYAGFLEIIRLVPFQTATDLAYRTS